MNIVGIHNPSLSFEALGLKEATIYCNLSSKLLTCHALKKGQGKLAQSGALAIETGMFTGCSPMDRFIVKDKLTQDTINWSKTNSPISRISFEGLYDKMIQYLEGKDVYIKDAYACTDSKHTLNIRLIAELSSSALFVNNMFLQHSKEALLEVVPDWTVLCVPNFKAKPIVDGTRRENFTIINFKTQQIIIGGTNYSGEIKKSIFSVLNYILPLQKEVLSMNCAANVGTDDSPAIFFGLSGTGKTTLSTSATRQLIGDDEHGWSENGIFNLEGGCYAKCLNLSENQEPEIFNAIRPSAVLENVIFYPKMNKPNFSDASITQNTRVSYPIHHIENTHPSSKSGHAKDIFFLTCDAFGVLPPISKLTPTQAIYHFISGYTSKITHTEAGISEPRAVFSACFKALSLPLNPVVYAEMLKEKIINHGTNVWLVNTGWSGGAYRQAKRIKLSYTRSIVDAALNGALDNVNYEEHPIFGLMMPMSCPNVPNRLLNPRNTWIDKMVYDAQAEALAFKFAENFEQYTDIVTEDILEAGPKVLSYA